MTTVPFRYDQVGSLLRPKQLKEARESFQAGRLTKAELTAIEDEAIITVIRKQKEIGLKAVTDGEFRRRWWHLDFIAALNGITVYDFETTAFGITTEAQGTFVSGQLSFNPAHPFLQHFQFTKQYAGDTLVKQTIPGPNMILLDSLILAKQYQKTPVYSDLNAFIADLITTYQEAIAAFYAAGCRYLQLDDTSWGGLFDERFRQMIKQNGYDPDQLIQQFGDITEAVLEKKPADMAITFHFCKGNFQSHWLYSGSYDKIAKRLLAINQFDGFFLEFDDERSGSFSPLKDLHQQRMVLGLVTTKGPQLEKKEQLHARIKEAATIVPLDQLCLSPQCGFSSTQEGNALTEEAQWDKLRLVVETAKEIWPDA